MNTNKLYYASDFGLVRDGNTLCTTSLQKLIDNVHVNGGGTIVFSAGKYLLSTVFLKSDVHILLNDAEILGSLDFDDYYCDEQVDYPLYQDASHSFFHCSMFVAENCNNISICGNGKIDMRSVWDEKNVRNMGHRGAKAIALKECQNVVIEGITVNNATDLAIYFAGCQEVTVKNVKVRTYIDGISPDGSQNVLIDGCQVESGDDGIVFKSSYTLNRLSACQNIVVKNCQITSRCNAIKFGTETNGDFKNITIQDVFIFNTRLSGIAVESVDGSHLDRLTFKNITMQNVNNPIFVHLGKRLRGPLGMQIGGISNLLFENVTAKGPYVPYSIIEWNYPTFVVHDAWQEPWNIGIAEGLVEDEVFCEQSPWQITTNVCGLPNHKLKNITFKNIDFQLNGGATKFCANVAQEPLTYPECFVYGRVLPAKGAFFRHIDGLTLDNFNVKTKYDDVRETFVFDNVTRKVIL